jgi:hypothetical protein
MATLYTTVTEHPLTDFKAAPWFTWTNASDWELTAGMAIQSHLRQRGGIEAGRTSIRLFAYVRDTMALPCVCRSFEVLAHRQAKPAATGKDN